MGVYIPTKLQAIIYIALGCTLSVVLDIMSKVLMNNLSTPAAYILSIRYVFATIVMAIFLFISKKKIRYKPNILLESSRGIVTAMAYLLWTYGLSRAGISFATLIVLLQPIFIMVFAKIFLKENMDKTKMLISVMLMLILSLVTSCYRQSTNISSILYLVLGTALFCLVDIITKKIIIKNDDRYTNVFFNCLFAMIFSAVLLIVTKEKISIKPLQLTLIFMMGVIYILAMLAFVEAFNKANLNFLAPYKYTEFIVGILLDYIVFSNMPNRLTQLYALCIIPSSILILILDKRRILKNHKMCKQK